MVGEGFMDLDGFTYTELERIRRRAQARMRELLVVEETATDMSALAAKYLVAAGVEQGDPWVKPSGYEDIYPEGWVVTHDGKEWVSTYDGNFTEPGVRGWRELVEEGEYPDYVKPVGYEDAYSLGDRVTHEGSVYESTADGNTWSPTETGAPWTLVD